MAPVSVAPSVAISSRVAPGPVLRLIERILGRGLDFSGFFRRDLSPLVRRHIAWQYATQGRHFGTPWEPIGPVTRKLRDRPGHGRGPRNAPMRDTLASYRALTGDGKPRGAVRVYGKDRMVLGADESLAYLELHHRKHGYLSTHIFGRQKKRPTRVAPRPVLPEKWPPAVQAEISLLMRSQFAAAIQGRS